MAEFDTSVNFRTERKFTLGTDAGRDVIIKEICNDDFLRKVGAKVWGDAGNGEVWLDCSDALRTRYLKVVVDENAQITVSSAFSMSRLCEVFFAGLILLFVWGLSKGFSPAAGKTGWLVLSEASFLAAAALIDSVTLGKQLWSRSSSAKLSEALISKFNRK